uniref:Uncharacterized protein n=1 Tax=Coccidioides posadasii RMSCC 3488 TaxID=454284 RepID=A0A0J6FAD9_COCPO|nr:hypothetical protein CPAG_03528 [Coccidioides posadasii RMSCC 3488]
MNLKDRDRGFEEECSKYIHSSTRVFHTHTTCLISWLHGDTPHRCLRLERCADPYYEEIPVYKEIFRIRLMTGPNASGRGLIRGFWAPQISSTDSLPINE